MERSYLQEVYKEETRPKAALGESMDNLRENISNNLIRLMNQGSLNQREMAARCELTPAALSQLINKQRTPSLETIIKICDKFSASIDWLIGRKP